MPVIRVGPPELGASRDFELVIDAPSDAAADRLERFVCEVASGRRAAGEATSAWAISLSNALPTLWSDPRSRSASAPE